MDKDLLRQKFILQRKSLTREVVALKSKKIFENFKDCNFGKTIKKVLVYISINNEVDTALITGYLIQAEVDMFLPTFEKGNWIVSEFINDKLKNGPFGTLQPAQVKKIDVDFLDLVIVPGVAYSKRGIRLGYGKGVYDKLLMNFPGIKVGLAYDFQVVDTLPFGQQDVKMDFLITESSVIKVE